MSVRSVYSVFVALHRVGPYHHARFEAAASLFDGHIFVLQTRPESQEYPWDFAVQDASYTLLSLEVAHNSNQDLANGGQKEQLRRLIAACNPAVIVSVGWADSVYLDLLSISQKSSIPIVIVSDSRERDISRSLIKEWLKRLLLRGYSSALVAGVQSRNYLRGLGMSEECIFQPWDVVDNQHFFELSRMESEKSSRDSLSPFICVGRFIPEKNHDLLLKAFSKYQSLGGIRPLMLIGHGQLESEIRKLCSYLPRPDSVTFVPFVQMHELVKYYSNALALILPSKKDTWGLVVNEAMASELPVIVSSDCGCAEDLIINGVTGLTFASGDAEDLLNCMRFVELQSSADRKHMTTSALTTINNFSLSSFAVGMHLACKHALSYPKFSLISRILASVLKRGLKSDAN